MKKITSKIALTVGFFTTLPLHFSRADLTGTVSDKFQKFSNKAGYTTSALGYYTDETIATKIGSAITVLLSFLGVLFLILVIVSGFQWMTAGGNADVIKKSKARLTNAIIGLAIILMAYLITYFIMNTLASTSGYKL